MEEVTRVQMIERVAVRKFDHTLEDHPEEPVDVVIQETVTEVSLDEARMMGFVPKSEQIDATGTVQLGASDAAAPGADA